MQFGKLKLGACKYGWMLHTGKFIGKCFELYGQYSEAEVHILRSFLSDGSVAFDIGANIGDLPIPMSRIIGESGRVIAVESQLEVFNVLCANLALNDLRNTRPVNAFLTSSTGTVEKIGAWGSSACLGDTRKLDQTVLDAFDVQRCDLIKIDVDGPELSMIEGGAMLTEKHRPILYVENDDREMSSRLLDLIMNDFGYRAYWHPTPMYDPSNFFGNPMTHWAPDNIVSLMILAIPKERPQAVGELHTIASTDAWWWDLKS